MGHLPRVGLYHQGVYETGKFRFMHEIDICVLRAQVSHCRSRIVHGQLSVAINFERGNCCWSYYTQDISHYHN